MSRTDFGHDQRQTTLEDFATMVTYYESAQKLHRTFADGPASIGLTRPVRLPAIRVSNMDIPGGRGHAVSKSLTEELRALRPMDSNESESATHTTTGSMSPSIHSATSQESQSSTSHWSTPPSLVSIDQEAKEAYWVTVLSPASPTTLTASRALARLLHREQRATTEDMDKAMQSYPSPAPPAVHGGVSATVESVTVSAMLPPMRESVRVLPDAEMDQRPWMDATPSMESGHEWPRTGPGLLNGPDSSKKRSFETRQPRPLSVRQDAVEPSHRWLPTPVMATKPTGTESHTLPLSSQETVEAADPSADVAPSMRLTFNSFNMPRPSVTGTTATSPTPHRSGQLVCRLCPAPGPQFPDFNELRKHRKAFHFAVFGCRDCKALLADRASRDAHEHPPDRTDGRCVRSGKKTDRRFKNRSADLLAKLRAVDPNMQGPARDWPRLDDAVRDAKDPVIIANLYHEITSLARSFGLK